MVISNQDRKLRADCLPLVDQGLALDVAAVQLQSHLQEQQAGLHHLHSSPADVSDTDC